MGKRVFLALAASLLSASAIACDLDDRSAPNTPATYEGIVRGPATAEEVTEGTQIAEIRTRAPISPAYVALPRVFVYFDAGGVRSGTIAAVTDGKLPESGATVKLSSRHRDPATPCSFIPWTVLGPAPQALLAPSLGVSELTADGGFYVPLKRSGGTWRVPVTLDGKITVDFVLDSGAADVSLPAVVVEALRRNGSLNTSDFVGRRKYRLADGSVQEAEIFRLSSVSVGGRNIADVIASARPGGGDPLLGQTFLGRFKSWSIDNARQALVLK